MALSTRDVKLLIGAEDNSSATLQAVAKNVDALTSALQATLDQAKQGDVPLGVLKDSLGQMNDLAKVLSVTFPVLMDRLAGVDKAAENSADSFEKAQAKLDAYKAKLGDTAPTDAQNNRIAALTDSVAKASARFDSSVAAMDAYRARLQEAGIDANNLAASENLIAESAVKLGNAIRDTNDGIKNYAANLKATRDAAAALAQQQTQQAAQQAAMNAEASSASLKVWGAGGTAEGQGTSAEDYYKKDVQLFNAAQEQKAESYVNWWKTALAEKDALDNAAQAKSDIGVFGLKPYELQNLGYQINDVVTQLASGTHLTQVIAQQGGQIIQIWQGSMRFLASSLPEIAGGIAIVATAYEVLSRAADQVAIQRQFGAALQVSADNAGVTSKQLLALQHSFIELGVASKDATSVIITGLQQGLQPDRIDAFARAAQDLSRIYGTDFKQNVQDVTTAFTGNLDTITALNSKYDFLTQQQYDRIRTLEDEGKNQQALTEAYANFIAKVDEGSAKAMGPWSQATLNFHNAWNSFLDDLADGPVAKGALAFITDLTNRFSLLLSTFSNAPQTLGQLKTQLADLIAQRDKVASGVGLSDVAPGGTAALMGSSEPGPTVDDLNASIAGVQKLIDAIKQKNQVTQDGATLESNASKARDLANQTYLRDLDRQLAAGKQAYNLDEMTANAQATADEARQKALAAGLSDKAAQQAYDDTYKNSMDAIAEGAKRELESLNDRTDATNRLGTAQARQAAIAAAGDRAALAETRAGGTADEIAQARAVGEQLMKNRQELQAQHEEAKTAKEQETAAQAALNALSGAQVAIEKQKTQTIVAQVQAITDEYAKYYAAIDKARGLGVKTLPDGTTLDQAQSELQAAEDQAKALVTIKGYEQQINDIVQQRNDLVATYKQLAADPNGLDNATAQKKIAEAYTQTNAQLQPLIATMQKQLDLAKANGSISNIAYENMSANLLKVTAESKNLNTTWNTVEDTFINTFKTGSNTLFTAFTDNLSKAIAGTESWGTAFKNAGVAMLQFFSSLLEEIAKALLQIEALQVAKAILGAIGAGFSAGAGAAAPGLANESIANQSIDSSIGGVYHEGGTVGSGSALTRRFGLPDSLWDTAPRYHSGALVGLGADERAAILKVGEEVLTDKDPRNALNGGLARGSGGQSADTKISVYPIINPADIAQAMASPAGERVVLAHVTRNSRTVRRIVGANPR